MNFHQLSALASMAFLLASFVIVLYGTELAGALGGAWSRGAAQAAAEKRRLGSAARGAAGSSAWQQARAAARGMPGTAAGASAWARRENGPLRRIAAAAATGAVIGGKGAARAAAGAKRRRAADGSRPDGSRGPASGTRPGSRFRSRRDIGVCDECRVPVARRSLEGNRCRLCRSGGTWRLTPGATAAGGGARPHPGTVRAGIFDGPQDRAPLAAMTSASGTPTTAAAPAGTTPVPLSAVPDGWAVPEVAASSTAAAAVMHPIALVPAGVDESFASAWPSRASLPAGGPPGTAGTAVLTPGTRTEINGGTHMTTGAVAVGSGRPGGGLAVRPGGQVGVGSEATNHGEWVACVEEVCRWLARIYRDQKLMVDNLTAVDASESQINDVDRWSDNISKVGTRIIADLLEIDGNLRPYIEAVTVAGGPAEVGSPPYHGDY